jgi:hypothetical protein
MKPKKIDKKLVVKKVTITHLNIREQLMIRAGGTVWTRGCEASCDCETSNDTDFC